MMYRPMEGELRRGKESITLVARGIQGMSANRGEGRWVVTTTQEGKRESDKRRGQVGVCVLLIVVAMVASVVELYNRSL